MKKNNQLNKLQNKIHDLEAQVAMLKKTEIKYKKIKKESQKNYHDLGERIKELNCLYSLSKLYFESDSSLEKILNESINLIPPSWQYPDITCSRIVLQDKEYKTDDFKLTKWKQSSDIKVNKKREGCIEVFYNEKKAKKDEGPFLKEERYLLDTIAKIVGKIIENNHSKGSLIKSEIKYRTLFESSKDGIVYTNMQGVFINANQTYLDMLGYNMEELSDLKYYQITPKKWIKIEEDIINNQIIKRGYSDEHEKEYINKDGTIFPVSVKAWLIEDKHGKPAGMWGIVRDITERKKMEASLLETDMLLSKKTVEVEKKNIALKEIIEQIELEKRQIEKRVATNVDLLLLPALKKLKLKSSPFNWSHFEILENNLNDLTSSFGSDIAEKRFNLTPREIEICNLIKQGVTSKEISSLLNIEFGTVEVHRYNIRKKIGIISKKINLFTHLKNLK